MRFGIFIHIILIIQISYIHFEDITNNTVYTISTKLHTQHKATNDAEYVETKKPSNYVESSRMYCCGGVRVFQTPKDSNSDRLLHRIQSDMCLNIIDRVLHRNDITKDYIFKCKY